MFFDRLFSNQQCSTIVSHNHKSHISLLYYINKYIRIGGNAILCIYLTTQNDTNKNNKDLTITTITYLHIYNKYTFCKSYVRIHKMITFFACWKVGENKRSIWKINTFWSKPMKKLTFYTQHTSPAKFHCNSISM